jgi:hypothetical protein
MADPDKDQTKVLLKMKKSLWARMKARAAQEQRPAFAVAATAFRDYLSKPQGKES